MKTLTRDEMKKVMGGYVSPVGEGKSYKCCIGDECTACTAMPNCSAKAKEVQCSN